MSCGSLILTEAMMLGKARQRIHLDHLYSMRNRARADGEFSREGSFGVSCDRSLERLEPHVWLCCKFHCRGHHDNCSHSTIRASFALDEAWGAPGARAHYFADHVGHARRVRLWLVGLHDQDSGDSQASHGAILRPHEAVDAKTTLAAEKDRSIRIKWIIEEGAA